MADFFNLPQEIFEYLLTFLHAEDLMNLEESSEEMKLKFKLENVWERRAQLVRLGKVAGDITQVLYILFLVLSDKTDIYASCVCIPCVQCNAE